MVTTKKMSKADRATLITCINDAAELQGEIADRKAALDARKAEIKDILKRHQMDRYATEAGTEAVISQQLRRSYDVDRLAEVVDADTFADLTEIKPRTPRCNDHLDDMPELRDCIKSETTVTRIEVRPAK
jgi:hypothetical protein